MNFLKKAKDKVKGKSKPTKDEADATAKPYVPGASSSAAGASKQHRHHHHQVLAPPARHGKGTFLHGQLFIDVVAAKDLPDMEGFVSKLVDKKDVTDPMVDIALGRANIGKTSVILNSLSPVWDEDFRIEVCHFAEELIFKVRDKDHARTELIGTVVVPTTTLLPGNLIDSWFPIRKGKASSTSTKMKGTLHLRLQYTSRLAMEKTYEVKSYFPMRRNCNVTLYQDAYCANVCNGELPHFSSLLDASGRRHEPASCWRDVHEALNAAQEFICITGWSVWDRLQLLRGNDLTRDNRTLGDILIDKADKGVKVFVMVWSEKISGDLKEEGFMGTHDTETFNHFKNTKVRCALAPREIEVKEFTDVLQNQFASGTYTHHQKSIICDAPNKKGAGRHLVAFVGGLDLTNGRFDSPDHPLFSTLLSDHYNDFYNSNAKSVSREEGPREPWHDIHTRVEGPIAHDVLLNFRERWTRQCEKYGDINTIDLSHVDVGANARDTNDIKSWNVQFFRSITSDSAVFDQAKAEGLNSKKGRMVDASIGQAYVQAIRNADNFIYIENQYFLGSAYCWLQNDDVNCHHTIPSEIAQKVVDKILLGERFCAYIVIPMFPEGDPASAPIQEILFWQARTIEMMYRCVGDAIRQAGLASHPTDWLVFMCPAKREAYGPHIAQLQEPEDELAKTLRQSLRFPIYVHSKMMIVDDAYIIVGSANINQRSMSGTRDTEMAVGCWQPGFAERNPYGDVHMFRRSLWTEHLRASDPSFLHPATIECVQRVKTMTYHNWQQYVSADAGAVTTGQLLPYPINVRHDGAIEYMDGVESFPDFPPTAKIMGKRSAMIPQKLTT